MRISCAIVLSCVALALGCRASLSGVKDETPAQAADQTLDLTQGFSPLMVFGPRYAWTKFIVTLGDQGKVYFQDANQFPLHFDFASRNVPEFAGMTSQQFDAKTLKNEGRVAITGSVLVQTTTGEVALELVAEDPLDRAFALSILKRVSAKITRRDGARQFYFPSAGQRDAALAERDAYEAEGFRLGNVALWESGNACYSGGWTIGRVVKVATADIDKAFAEGRLKSDDILLTEDVPAEIPVVAGVISLKPATRNSHVAILSQSYGIPFAYFEEAKLAELARGLDHKEALLTVEAPSASECTARLKQAAMPKEHKERLLKAKTLPPLVVRRTPAGRYLAPVRELDVKMADKFGGKASNFSSLLRSVPDNTYPEAHALSLDLWADFMAQAKGPGGASLRSEIDAALGEQTFPPRDVMALKDALKRVRKMIKDAAFPEALSAPVLQSLRDARFVLDRKIRLRSSTNVEDSDTFTGAGLYDSKSGCLGDDVEPAAQGSRCGGAEKDTVTSAIKKVYASFYNDNAYIERLRRKVDEKSAGMALLVHYSSPDPDELANAVATIAVTEWGVVEVTLVSQIGAESITNPVPGNEPETVVMGGFVQDARGAGLDGLVDAIEEPRIVQRAGRLSDGRYVFGSKETTLAMGKAIAKASLGFVKEKAIPVPFTLDLEVKKQRLDGQEKLIVKQVRPVPQPMLARTEPYILAGHVMLCQVQSGDFVSDEEVFPQLTANHDFKGQWVLSMAGGFVEELREGPLYTRASGRYVDGGTIREIDVPFAQLRGLRNERGTDRGRNIVFKSSWEGPETGRKSTFATTLSSGLANTPGMPAIYDYEILDGAISSFSNLRFAWGEEGEGKLAAEYMLCDIRKPGEDQPRQVTAGGAGGRIQTSYRYGKSLVGKSEKVLAAFDQTTITGLTTTPIELRSDFSQTYTAGHHNFSEFLLFDPRREPGLAPQLLEELRQKNVAMLYATGTFEEWKLFAVGFDGQQRPLE